MMSIPQNPWSESLRARFRERGYAVDQPPEEFAVARGTPRTWGYVHPETGEAVVFLQGRQDARVWRANRVRESRARSVPSALRPVTNARGGETTRALERHAQSELHVPLKVDLVRRHHAETAGVDADVGRAVDRCVEEIERLDPHLRHDPVADARVLEYRERPLRLPRIADVAEPHIQRPEVVRRNHRPRVASFRPPIRGISG